MSIRLAFGVPGAGKSTLLHDLVAAHAQTHRLLVQDNEAQWGPDGVHWRGRPPKLLRVFYEADFEAFRAEALEGDEPPPPGVYVFRGVDPNAVAQLCAEIGDTVYVNDEIDRIARRKGWETSALRDIVHEGRHLEAADGEHRQVHLLGACRRPQNLHTDLTDLCDEVFCFRLKGKNTRDRLLADNVIEDEAEWERIRALPNFEFKHMPSEQWLRLAPVGNGAPPTAPQLPAAAPASKQKQEK